MLIPIPSVSLTYVCRAIVLATFAFSWRTLRSKALNRRVRWERAEDAKTLDLSLKFFRPGTETGGHPGFRHFNQRYPRYVINEENFCSQLRYYSSHLEYIRCPAFVSP